MLGLKIYAQFERGFLNKQPYTMMNARLLATTITTQSLAYILRLMERTHKRKRTLQDSTVNLSKMKGTLNRCESHH